jgi:hypothetical protein
VLKILVQAQVREPASLSRHRFIKLDIPDENSCDSLDESQLPTDWSRRVSLTRAWGDRWLREGHAAVLRVRSVFVPETYNLILNPRHTDATRINRLMSCPYPLDSRLLEEVVPTRQSGIAQNRFQRVHRGSAHSGQIDRSSDQEPKSWNSR